MKEWEYTFDPVSKEQWIRQIESDLKGKDFDSLSGEWWPGEPRIPVLHEEDMEEEMIQLPDALFNAPPRLLDWMENSNLSPSDINHKILSALMYGAQSVVLQTGESTYFTFSEWLQNVSTDSIELHIHHDLITTKNINSFIHTISGNAFIRLSRIHTAEPLSAFLKKEILSDKSENKRLKFVYRFNAGGHWINETSMTLQFILDDLTQWVAAGFPPGDFFERCILWVDTDPDYFKSILQIRVLHLLWKNFKQIYVQEQAKVDEKYMECHIHPVRDEKADHFLIRASMAALGASLAGVHALCIHHMDSDHAPPFYQRIHRNIHHLLYLESGAYKGRDPLAGAYAIDFHTRRWVKEIWEQSNVIK